MAWKLIAKRYEIDPFGATGHLFYDVLNDSNQRVYQVHGFATDAAGNIMTYGGIFDSSDKIKVYVQPQNGTYEGSYSSQQLYSGT